MKLYTHFFLIKKYAENFCKEDGYRMDANFGHVDISILKYVEMHISLVFAV